MTQASSTTTTITRRFHFSSGHRVYGHESKCANVHGHNYVLMVHATADHLDPLGRIIDFSVLKDLLGSWIDENWDHGFIAYAQDKEVILALERLSGQKVFRSPTNPTAENMALYFLQIVAPQQLEGTGVHVVKVTLHETENCFAEVFVKVEAQEKREV